jgi:hypothetical protein
MRNIYDTNLLGFRKYWSLPVFSLRITNDTCKKPQGCDLDSSIDGTAHRFGYWTEELISSWDCRLRLTESTILGAWDDLRDAAS